MGPNWKEALKSGDQNMKFLDYMFSLEKWEERPQGNVTRKAVNMPDNRSTMIKTNPTKIQ